MTAKEIDRRITARPHLVIEPGTLVMIQRTGSFSHTAGPDGWIVAWYEVRQPTPDIRAHLFKEKCLYGMYLGVWNHPTSKLGGWHEVMTAGKVFIFEERQITNFPLPVIK